MLAWRVRSGQADGSPVSVRLIPALDADMAKAKRFQVLPFLMIGPPTTARSSPGASDCILGGEPSLGAGASDICAAVDGTGMMT